MKYVAAFTARGRRLLLLAGLCATFLGLAGVLCAQAPTQTTSPVLGPLTRDGAVHLALVNNPFLMAVREQNGFGAAAVVISQTYPFNPVYTGYVTSANGPANAGVTNNVYNEHYISLEVEIRGQGKHRRAAACATASKIEWEVTNQEMAVTIAVIRAYNATLYRQQKLELFEQTVGLNEQLFEQTQKAADAGKVKALDLVLARADLDSLRAQRSQVRTTLAVARSELRRQLGLSDDSFAVTGGLDVPLPTLDPDQLTQMALEQRPDLKAKRAALGEAEANLRLVEANRYGNPSIGPYYEYDPTRVSYWGVRISAPIPVFNQRKGEIMKAQTDVNKVRADVNQIEVQSGLDVRAALARLADARQWVATYDNEVIPGLLKARQELDRLAASNDPAADPGKLVTVRKALIKGMESQLDAHYEFSQAQVDLAVAIADPAVAVGPSASAMNAARKATLSFEKK
jgi:outer membrane protein, heavy metal efflux system